MKKQPATTNYLAIALSTIGLAGVLVFGLPSPDDRPKVYELYLAGFWILLTISNVGMYAKWKQSPWPRRIFAIIAPLIGLLYLQKYFLE